MDILVIVTEYEYIHAYWVLLDSNYGHLCLKTFMWSPFMFRIRFVCLIRFI